MNFKLYINDAVDVEGLEFPVCKYTEVLSLSNMKSEAEVPATTSVLKVIKEYIAVENNIFIDEEDTNNIKTAIHDALFTGASRSNFTVKCKGGVLLYMLEFNYE